MGIHTWLQYRKTRVAEVVCGVGIGLVIAAVLVYPEVRTVFYTVSGVMVLVLALFYGAVMLLHGLCGEVEE